MTKPLMTKKMSTARERRRVETPLARVPAHWPQLAAWHAGAVEFKFHPRHENPGHEELARRQAVLVEAWRELFLWLESARLGRPFADVAAYADGRGRLFPASSAWRNGLLHARDTLRRKITLRRWRDYPRATLQRALALLLVEEGRKATAARLLGLSADASREGIEAAYRRGW